MSTLVQNFVPKQTLISQFFGYLLVLLGLVVIFGWYLQNTVLIQIHPSLVPMQFNTALGFLLSGASLLLTLKQLRHVACVLGAIVCLMGGLTLFEYLNQVDLGIDQLFIVPHVTTNTPFPGRMAANTAFCFVISGAALAMINLSVRLNRASILGAVITGLGLISLLGYLVGIETAYGWGTLSQMAIHTSVGFVLLGVGITSGVNKVSSQSKYALHLRNTLSIGMTFFVLVIALWQALENWDENKFNLFLTEQLDSIHDAKKAALTSHIQAFERMAQRWSFDQRTSLEAWESDAYSYIRYFQGLQAVVWLDDSRQLRRVVPLRANEDGSGLHSELAEGSQVIFQHDDKREMSLSIRLIGETYEILLYTPVYVQGEFDGYLVGVIQLEKLLNDISSKSTLGNKYKLAIYEGNELLVSNDLRPGEYLEQNSITADFSFMDIEWRTVLIPNATVVAQHKSYFPVLVLLVGCFMSALLILLLHMRYREDVRSKQLEEEVEVRKQIQLALLEKEERLRVTLENMFDAVILISDQGSIISFNKAAESIFGYQTEEVIGKNINMLMPEPYHSSHDNYINNYLQTGEAKVIGLGREVLGLRQNGEVFPMTLAVSDMLIKDKHFFSGIVRDISQQKQAEQEKKKYTAQLERSNKELDDFAYIASHDLKAPLRGIMQLASWIEEDINETASEKTKEYLFFMRSRIGRLDNLLNDLLAYSRIGRKQGDFKLINVEDTVIEVFNLVSSPSKFSLKCEIDLTEITTLITPFELILRNLFSNAIKHHDKDHGLITVTAREDEFGYVFSVIDDGPGILPKHHERVFGLFQTLKPRDEVEGSGMGLAIIKKVLERYQCTIKIKSDGVRGTIIDFTWPSEANLRKHIDE